jgi:hypothetical protein
MSKTIGFYWVFLNTGTYIFVNGSPHPCEGNNVIMSAWIIVRSGTLDVDIRGVPFIGGFLISGD